MATIDILMATYNGEKYVAEQIESVQRQSFEDWRLLVSDDCSTDNTLDVVRYYADGDHRIHIVSEGKRFGSAKMNFMNLLASSDAAYSMFCDQDDVWLPFKVQVSLDYMHRLEGSLSTKYPLLVFSDMTVVDSNLGQISPSFIRDSRLNPYRTDFRLVLAQSIGAGCTMIVNNTLVELMKRAVDQCDMIMHDHWATIIAAAFGAIGFAPLSTSLYRQHEANVIGADSFSLVDRISHMDRMRERYSKSVRQAAAFGHCYESMLNSDQLRTIEHYKRTLGVHPLKGIGNLFICGCWKSGIRKLGQIAVILGGAK